MDVGEGVVVAIGDLEVRVCWVLQGGRAVGEGSVLVGGAGSCPDGWQNVSVPFGIVLPSAVGNRCVHMGEGEEGGDLEEGLWIKMQ